MEARQLHPLSQSFTEDVIKAPDHEEGDIYDAEVKASRDYLVDKVFQSTACRRLLLVPVRTVLCIPSYQARAAAWGENNPFFDIVVIVIEDTRSSQDGRDPIWTMGARLAPLSVERIDLRLGVVPLRATFLEAPSACVEKDIPVVCSTLTLDVRSMDCQESHLERFINAVTRAATTKDTITFRTGNVHTQRTEGDNGGDLSGNILMLLRCIGQLGYEVSLDLSGLFSTSQENKNCQAVVRGLIEYIFPRSSPMGLTLAETVVVTDEDDAVFRRETIRWRQDHPGQKLRLRSLHLWLEIGCVESVRTLVAILDDVDELSIDWIEDKIVEEDIKAMLRFPSLRNLVVTNASINSTDIFAANAGNTPKLHLERLKLDGLTLASSTSIVEFIKSLDPQSSSASSMSQTLQSLSIEETDGSVYWQNAEDEDEIVFPLLRLAINDPTAVVALHDVLTSNQTPHYVNFVGDFPSSKSFQGIHRLEGGS